MKNVILGVESPSKKHFSAKDYILNRYESAEILHAIGYDEGGNGIVTSTCGNYIGNNGFFQRKESLMIFL